MNILVTGGNGQLGRCFQDIASISSDHKLFLTNHDTLDIAVREDVEKYVSDNEIDVILNFAAYTDVAAAENDPEAAFNANSLGPQNLANAIIGRNGVLIHISTDFVYAPFNGWDGSPFAEGDSEKNPFSISSSNTYSWTKRVGEILIENSGCRYLIIRTSWLYSVYGSNFLTKVFKLLNDGLASDDKLKPFNGMPPLKFVCDEVGSPTNANSLAWFIYTLIEKNEVEKITRDTINFSDFGVCSRYDFACTIRRLLVERTHLNYPVILPCYASDFNTNVKRPHFSAMSQKKLLNTYHDYLIDGPQYNLNWSDNLSSEIGKLLKIENEK